MTKKQKAFYDYLQKLKAYGNPKFVETAQKEFFKYWEKYEKEGVKDSMTIAMGANPKLKKVAPWIYLINVFVAYTMKRLGITPFAIHLIYCVMFYTKMNYVFAIHKPEKLNLTDSERQILDLKLQGKQQKEIDLYSQQTISAKMKSARERNLCETTEELMAKYAKEKESN